MADLSWLRHKTGRSADGGVARGGAVPSVSPVDCLAEEGWDRGSARAHRTAKRCRTGDGDPVTKALLYTCYLIAFFWSLTRRSR